MQKPIQRKKGENSASIVALEFLKETLLHIYF